MKRFYSVLTMLLFSKLGFGQVPVITSISSYSAVPGSVVSIYGSNLSASGVNEVYFQGVKGTIVNNYGSQVDAIVPLRAGYGPVTINAGGLIATSSFDFLPTFYG